MIIVNQEKEDDLIWEKIDSIFIKKIMRKML